MHRLGVGACALCFGVGMLQPADLALLIFMSAVVERVEELRQLLSLQLAEAANLGLLKTFMQPSPRFADLAAEEILSVQRQPHYRRVKRAAMMLEQHAADLALNC